MTTDQTPIRTARPNVNDRARAQAAERRAAPGRSPVTDMDAEQEAPGERMFTPGETQHLASQPQPARPVPTFTIHALLDDFPIEVAFSGTADQLRATVARLRELGAVPPTSAARQAVAEEKAREAPVCTCDACDRYGKPMKESTKQQGGYYCPGKVGMKAGSPIYCKERA